MKNLPLILILLFGFSLAQERVIIENNNGIYNVKVQNLPKPQQKRKHSKKYYQHNKIYKKHPLHKQKYYIASKNGKVFHEQNCKFAKRIKKEIKFKTRKEAFIQGLKPCKYCKP